MIHKIISDLWTQVITGFFENNLSYSSEKTLVFHFAWQLKQKLGEDLVSLDFEKQMFQKFSDGAFLDLYFEYKNQKIGIEFKFPKRSSKGYSNSTQTRIKSINDIKRLSYLVNNNKIDLGVFLMATNERAYVFTGKKTINAEFETYHLVQYKKGESFPKHQSTSKECLISPIEITFTWNGINETNIINKFAWISPIFIYKDY